jgi:NDP-sugar pyrophosphorylase family protein
MRRDELLSEIKKTQVVVLAGGKAKRMGIDIPKCLLEIGGKTLVDRCIESLVDEGFSDYVFLLGHKYEMVMQHIGDGSRYGINVGYSIDPPNSSGVGKGKAFKHALVSGAVKRDRRSIILFPDDFILEENVYSKFLASHLDAVKKYDVLASSVLVPGTEYPYGVAEVDNNGMIVNFTEKPLVTKPTNVGIYAFAPQVYDMVDAKIKLESLGAVELESTVLPVLAKERKLSSFFIPSNKWLPINTVKEYERAVKILAVK